MCVCASNILYLYKMFMAICGKICVLCVYGKWKTQSGNIAETRPVRRSKNGGSPNAVVLLAAAH